MKWEYKISDLSKEMKTVNNELAELGEEGWELVAIIHHIDAPQFFGHKRSDYFAFFKRQKNEG